MYVQGGGCSGLSYGMGLEKEPEDDDLILDPIVMNCDIATTTIPAPINPNPANNFKSI